MTIVLTNPEPQSPDWWLRKLSQKLDDRSERLVRFDRYYAGQHNLEYASTKFRRAFGPLFREFADNWCKLIADAPNERLTVSGFRYDDEKGDKKAWKIWQENELDSFSHLAHLEALIHGESYVLVWPDEDNTKAPYITIEHPLECIVEFAPGSRRKRLAGLKRWVDEEGYSRANVFLPDGLYKYRSTNKSQDERVVRMSEGQWQQADEWDFDNPLDVVPLVPFLNEPRLLGGGVSEIADAIPVQDAINKTIADLLITSEFAAAPRRYATGFTPPKDDDGNVLPLETMVDRLLTSSNDKTEFGQFPQADLGGFVETVEMFVQHLASRSRTPPHYFYIGGQFPSGESIKSAETGLVAKVVRKSRPFGESWEEVMRLSMLVTGDRKRSKIQSAETVWADPESRSESEHIDAVGKKRALLHIPLEQAWADAGYSPQQIERMKEQLLDEKKWLGALGLDQQAEKGTRIFAGAGNKSPGEPADGSVPPE